MIKINEEVTPNDPTYNFDDDIKNHISNVRHKVQIITQDLSKRAEHHDDSKLVEPEYSIYKKFTEILRGLEYGSSEYKKVCNDPEFNKAFSHHSSNNRHHPEYFKDGVQSMTLVDLIEMLCDWKAASERHQNASWLDGFQSNCERFGISDDLMKVLWNTYKEYLR